MHEIVLIPHERIGVVIGKKGQTKEALEKRAHVHLTVEEQGVLVEGRDLEAVFKAADVVKAIGRGFSPEDAFLLLDGQHELVIVTLQGETEKATKRLMARVIGRKGTTKNIIEQETQCLVAVFGKTVSLIGIQPTLSRAEHAVEEILKGRSHGYVYAKLKKE